MKRAPIIDCDHCESRPHGVFCLLKKEGLTTLNLEKNSNSYKKGQTLFIEGNPAFGLYCVREGKIKISKVNSEGKETIVRIASNGDLLGHRSLFSDSPYTASATVLEDAEICFVAKGTITKLIQEDPSLAFEVIRLLGEQMGAAEERIASLAQKSNRERFAELLLLLKESFGEEKDGRIKLGIHLTREEMASIIGIATENVTRLVSEFKRDQLIVLEGKDFYLVNIPEIEKLAGLSI